MSLNNLTKLIFIILAIAISGGCSTIATHSNDDVIPLPYAGTKLAVSKSKRQWKENDVYGALAVTIFDIPFSAIADTLMFPIDLIRDTTKKNK